MNLKANRARTVLAALTLTAASACAAPVDYSQTPVPTETTAAPSATPAAAQSCTNATQSYTPAAALDTNLVPAKIRQRGKLVVGVSGDTYLFGARNPIENRLEGFDIDLAKAVAKAIFGDENKVTFRVITAAQRIDLLRSGDLDMVARNMTMTCDRWGQIAFSSEYYAAGQKVLVASTAKERSLDDLAAAKKRVCAPKSTTSMAVLLTYASKGVVPVEAANHTGCLVMFQQGLADAITGDDTVLAGLAAQDPYTKVTDAKAITSEPYGLGFPQADTQFVTFVNRLLEDMKADGRWKKLYDTWLAESLGAAPKPPVAVFGRPA